jgi:hypothetical protein
VTYPQVDSRFTDALGRQQVMRAMMSGADGWLVQTSVEGRPFARHCGDWQGVERTLFWLRRHVHESSVPAPAAAVRPFAAAVAAVMLFAGAAASFAQLPPPETLAGRQFTKATRAYASLHRRVEKNLPALQVNSNPETLHLLVEQMAVAIRAARPDARQGEFFTDALAVEVRLRIAGALAAHGLTAWDVHAMEAADEIDPSRVSLTVNSPFPWRYASAMFPCVLEALPALPPELQYRIVGSTLVLIDVHAGLILDLLPHALADTEL